MDPSGGGGERGKTLECTDTAANMSNLSAINKFKNLGQRKNREF